MAVSGFEVPSGPYVSGPAVGVFASLGAPSSDAQLAVRVVLAAPRVTEVNQRDRPVLGEPDLPPVLVEQGVHGGLQASRTRGWHGGQGGAEGTPVHRLPADQVLQLGDALQGGADRAGRLVRWRAELQLDDVAAPARPETPGALQ